MAGRLKRFRKNRPLQEVAEEGNTAYTPEFLSLCADSIRDNCNHTDVGSSCVFAEDGICNGNCTLHRNTPNFWKRRR